jgi:hypothetical protein
MMQKERDSLKEEKAVALQEVEKAWKKHQVEVQDLQVI